MHTQNKSTTRQATSSGGQTRIPLVLFLDPMPLCRTIVKTGRSRAIVCWHWPYTIYQPLPTTLFEFFSGRLLAPPWMCPLCSPLRWSGGCLPFLLWDRRWHGILHAPHCCSVTVRFLFFQKHSALNPTRQVPLPLVSTIYRPQGHSPLLPVFKINPIIIHVISKPDLLSNALAFQFLNFFSPIALISVTHFYGHTFDPFIINNFNTAQILISDILLSYHHLLSSALTRCGSLAQTILLYPQDFNLTLLAPSHCSTPLTSPLVFPIQFKFHSPSL